MTKAESKKACVKCPEIDPKLVMIINIQDFRLLKKIRNDYPFAEIIVKTQDGHAVMIERAIVKDSLTESKKNE